VSTFGLNAQQGCPQGAFGPQGKTPAGYTTGNYTLNVTSAFSHNGPGYTLKNAIDDINLLQSGSNATIYIGAYPLMSGVDNNDDGVVDGQDEGYLIIQGDLPDITLPYNGPNPPPNPIVNNVTVLFQGLTNPGSTPNTNNNLNGCFKGFLVDRFYNQNTFIAFCPPSEPHKQIPHPPSIQALGTMDEIFHVNTQSGFSSNLPQLSNLSSVSFDNLIFLRMNEVYSYIKWYNYSNPNYLDCYDYDFINTITVRNTKEVHITNSVFDGYHRAIEYSNDVDFMHIENNKFYEYTSPICYYNTFTSLCSTYVSNGTSYQYNFLDNGIVHNQSDGLFSKAIRMIGDVKLMHPGRIANSIIKKNFIGSTSAYNEFGCGIEFSPYYFGAPINSKINPILYKVKHDVLIQENEIRGLSLGIKQGPVLPDPLIDDSYFVNITQNKLYNHEINLEIASPTKASVGSNKLMNINNNEFKADCINSIYGGVSNISFGGIYAYYYVEDIIFGQSTWFSHKGPNRFGYELEPSQNNTFINGNNCGFNSLNNYSGNSLSCNYFYPKIFIQGVFEPQINWPTPSDNAGIKIRDLVFPGSIEVYFGLPTTIESCTLLASCPTFGPLHVPNGMYSGLYYTQGLTDKMQAPILHSAYLTFNGNVEVELTINDPNFISMNGQFELEFYKSNAKGDLVNSLYKHTISPGLINDFTVPIPINPNNININYSDRIAVTITAKGTNGGIRCGTSRVSYIQIGHCPNCVSDFSPIPGKKYIVSVWAKIQNMYNGSPISVAPTSYDMWHSFATPVVEVKFYNSMNPLSQLGNSTIFRPKGPIVDGWQKIEGVFEVPVHAKGFTILNKLDASQIAVAPMMATKAFFDDIRIFPADGNMKSYVYDQETLQFIAELDENNYATFYEYNNEGKLVRVKKETERGVRTIKETKSNQPIR
jgi:hypothetical protein